MYDYTCHFCNTKHSNLESYANCVARCNSAAMKRKAAEEEAKRKAEQEAEKLRLESARKSRKEKIKQLEMELNKLYEEEYNEFPDTRRIQIEETTDLLKSILPEFFGGKR